MADRKPDHRLLEQEACRRVREALKAGAARKKAFIDVARAMNALGYRNLKGSALRAASIENLYYNRSRKSRPR
jgi:hypothetical protein